jgi:4-hydroxy-tetrahydrodipicolinate synthase
MSVTGKRVSPDKLQGVWSAAPTPFTAKMAIDGVSVGRMVEHHIRLGVRGLFLAGSNGEGPWMTDSQRSELVRLTARAARGRLVLAVQVTDNSAARILDNIGRARADGADIAVIAPPYFLFNDTPDTVGALYRQAIRKSPLPVGIYDRGIHSSVLVSEGVLAAVYAEPKVVLVKDSSSDPSRRRVALAARKKRPTLRLLNGDEFHCVEYLRAGYDGLLLGGGVFNGLMANQIVAAVAGGDIAGANRLQERMIRIMYDVYGGKDIACWLSGEKKLLVEMGLFRTWSSYLGYPLTASCRRAIAKVLKADKDVLWP